MKKILGTTLIFASTLLIFGEVAKAEEVAKEKTDVGIILDKNGVTEGPFKDNLAIVYRPLSFNFGTNKPATSGTSITYKYDGNSQYFVVNDDRSLDEATTATSAWTAKAQFSDFTATSDTSDKLNATINLGLENLQSYDIGTTLNANADDLTPNPIEGDNVVKALTDEQKVGMELGGTTGITKTAVKLEAGKGAQKILAKNVANDNKGGFITEIKDVTMTIVGSKDKTGAYKGTIDWTLEDTY